MYAIVGVSGNTGGAVARTLLARRAPVRAVVRDPAKGRPWESLGAEVAVADLADSVSLAAAFSGARAAYVLNPPAYEMPDIFARAEALAGSILDAVRKSGLEKLVVLSSVGAHLASGNGNIRTNGTFERVLGVLGPSVVFLRPAYFMENWAWVAAAASNDGVLPSFLSPLDRAIPMAAAADIGSAAAQALLGKGTAARVIELAGPRDFSPNDAAAAFTRALGRPVTAVALPQGKWPEVLAGSGFSPATIASWVELFRGFNSGWIAFENPASALRGSIGLDDAVGAIVRGKAVPADA